MKPIFFIPCPISGNTNYAASTARGILRHLNGGDTYKEPIPAPPTGNSNARIAKRKQSEKADALYFTFAPNPARQFTMLNYQLSDSEPAALTISDVEGKIIFRANLSMQQDSKLIPTDTWGTGTYFYQNYSKW